MKKNVRFLIAMMALLLAVFLGSAASADTMDFALEDYVSGPAGLTASVARSVTRTEQERDASFDVTFA